MSDPATAADDDPGRHLEVMASLTAA
ncbi:MAG: hypothetical protein QOE89_4199, partial [Pseudonocardiales bacterium]|nr:hypothetical protein [Pseudonocardiales bacterium]